MFILPHQFFASEKLDHGAGNVHLLKMELLHFVSQQSCFEIEYSIVIKEKSENWNKMFYLLIKLKCVN